MKTKLLGLAIICSMLFVQCNCNNEQKKIDKQAAAIPVKLTVVRFEQLLFAANQQNNFDALQKKHPSFFDLYTTKILELGNPDSIKIKLAGFCNNRAIKGLNDSVQKQYDNFSAYETQLQQAFQYYKFYFPKNKIPTIYTFISEFGYGVITTDSAIGIGLDMFLGNQYPYYSSVGFPNFIIKKCTPQNIVPSVMKATAQALIDAHPTKRRLIDKMIAAGKVLYFTDKMLPYFADSLKTNYSTTQLIWCKNNEYKIWEYFVKHNLLFTTDMMEISHYIGDTPVTPGMPPDAPGNIGMWVGGQIVQKYFAENPTATFEQLMNENDGQKILEAAKYKPSKN